MTLDGRHGGLLYCFFLTLTKPGVLAVVLYRLNSYFHGIGLRWLVRIVDFGIFYFGHAEVHVGSVIKEGLVLPDRGGVGIPAFAIIGKNCTFLGPALLTVGGMEGIDLANDKIIMGDYCIVGHGARIIGAIHLGNATQIKPNSVVMTSFPKAGYVLSGIPARRRQVIPENTVRDWNPLVGLPLASGTSA
jgi:serine O-acetyltransferase